MSDRTYKVSPDGDSVAVRSDFPANHQMAYGVMNAVNGGYWASEEQLEGWRNVTQIAEPVVPQEDNTQPPTSPTE